MTVTPKPCAKIGEDSLRRLGTEVIDLYYLHRWDPRVPIEESVGAMACLKDEGKIRALGLSEVGVDTKAARIVSTASPRCKASIRCGHGNAELGTLAACQDQHCLRRLSPRPLGRALDRGLQDVDTLAPGDIRTTMPRLRVKLMPATCNCWCPSGHCAGGRRHFGRALPSPALHREQYHRLPGTTSGVFARRPRAAAPSP